MSQSIERAVDYFSRLPGIGEKSARRLIHHILKMSKEEVNEFARALVDLNEKVINCSVCYTVTENDPCKICSDPKRDHSIICIVEEPKDVAAIERTNEYYGLYHVLGGALSPLEGIGPEDLYIGELIKRVESNGQNSGNGEIKEIILALDPNIDGEATTVYLNKLIKPLRIKVTRIARGLPIGSDLEYADQATLARAIEGRVEV